MENPASTFEIDTGLYYSFPEVSELGIRVMLALRTESGSVPLLLHSGKNYREPAVFLPVWQNSPVHPSGCDMCFGKLPSIASISLICLFLNVPIHKVYSCRSFNRMYLKRNCLTSGKLSNLWAELSTIFLYNPFNIHRSRSNGTSSIVDISN